jgi:hypothetical protein
MRQALKPKSRHPAKTGELQEVIRNERGQFVPGVSSRGPAGRAGRRVEGPVWGQKAAQNRVTGPGWCLGTSPGFRCNGGRFLRVRGAFLGQCRRTLTPRGGMAVWGRSPASSRACPFAYQKRVCRRRGQDPSRASAASRRAPLTGGRAAQNRPRRKGQATGCYGYFFPDPTILPSVTFSMTQ